MSSSLRGIVMVTVVLSWFTGALILPAVALRVFEGWIGAEKRTNPPHGNPPFRADNTAIARVTLRVNYLRRDHVRIENEK